MCHVAHEHVVVQLHVIVEYVVVVSGGLVYLLFELLLERRIKQGHLLEAKLAQKFF